MSVQAITAALALKGVTSSEKLLLIVLANYAGDDGRCWPSQSTLAANTMLSDRNVRRVLMSLETKALIKRRGRYNGSGRSSDVITLNLVADMVSGTKSGMSATPRTQRPAPADTMSGEPTNEPSLEPSGRKASPRSRGATPSPEEREEVARSMRELAASLGKKKLVGNRAAA